MTLKTAGLREIGGNTHESYMTTRDAEVDPSRSSFEQAIAAISFSGGCYWPMYRKSPGDSWVHGNGVRSHDDALTWICTGLAQ